MVISVIDFETVDLVSKVGKVYNVLPVIDEITKTALVNLLHCLF